MRIDQRAFTIDELEKMLDDSENYRNLTRTYRDKWYRAMCDGKWIDGHPHALVVTHAGCIVDGQHRLSAALRWQRETGNLITWNVAIVSDREAELLLPTLDVGKPRNLGDALRRNGVKNVTTVATICNAALRQRERGWCSSVFEGGQYAPSVEEMLRLYHADRSAIDRASDEGVRISSVPGMSGRGVYGTMGYFLGKISRTWWDRFSEKVVTGAEMHEGHPIMLLRARLIQDSMAMRAKGLKLPKAQTASLIIKAWNAFVSGTEIRRLMVRRLRAGDRDTPDEFPIPQPPSVPADFWEHVEAC